MRRENKLENLVEEFPRTDRANEEGNNRKKKRYGSWRKYIWGGVGATFGGLYGSMLPVALDPIVGLLEGPAVGTFCDMKVFLGYHAYYHTSSVNNQAALLNILLWGTAVGGITYLLKRHKEKTINESKPPEEEKGNRVWRYFKRQVKKTRWKTIGSIIGLGIGLPVLTSTVAELRKYLTPKTPPGYELVVQDKAGEMSCSPLEEKIAYTSHPYVKAGIIRRGNDTNASIKIFDAQKGKKDILGEGVLDLLLNPISGSDPVWSLNGKWIYYTKYENNQPNIYRVKPNSKDNELVEEGFALSSFSESGRMIKVDADGYIWIDDEKTPFQGVEPYLVEEKNLLVYQKLREEEGLFKGDLKSREETFLTSKAGWVHGDEITVPTRGGYKGKIIGLDHNEGIYVIDPKTGSESLLKKGGADGDLAISSDGSKLYVGLAYIPPFSDSIQSFLLSYKLPEIEKLEFEK